MTDNIAINVTNVTKTYRLYNSHADRVKEAFHPLRKKYHYAFNALNNVSFEVKKGEAFGVIGRNGSGKSTLLQIVCGILQPTSGTIYTNGRISALLELGAGFNPEFTGRENVYINGKILGFTDAEIDARFDEIAGFADIGEFMDQPVKVYSSGMVVRLAFAVQVCVEPDLLIVDEALSVGDIFFQQKCFARMREIISKGTTCLFVSHDTAAIQNLCQRAILLNQGEIAFMGDATEAVSRYFAAMTKSQARIGIRALKKQQSNSEAVHTHMDPAEILNHNILRNGSNRHGAGGLEIVAARITDSEGHDTLQVEMMQSLWFYLLLRANEDITDPSAGIHLFDRMGNLVFAAGTRQLNHDFGMLSSGQQVIVRFEVDLNVQPDKYTFSLGTGEPTGDQDPNIGYIHDRYEMLGPITVTADLTKTLPFYGCARLPMRITHWHLSKDRGAEDMNCLSKKL
jgi:lipopolysaccharide transport system ATP-binding protein